MEKAIDIAKYVVNYCVSKGKTINNMQLQMILFILQKYSLNKYYKPLFDDDIEAWQFGPVVPEIYYNFCAYGSTSIMQQDETSIDIDCKKWINKMVDDKCTKHIWDLAMETSISVGAWDITFNNGFGNHKVIPKELIAERG